MKPYRIFLASSSELSHERLAFVAFIHDYNKEVKKYNISLEVEWWEDLDDHFNTSNKQQDYNEALKECHFLVMLFWTKVGKYTLEEFNLGLKLYAEKGLPYVYCYEKKCSEDKEQQSKKDFLSSINKSGEEQFQTSFDDFVKVTEQFRKNFQRLLDDRNNHKIVSNTQPATLLSTKAADEPQGFLGREEELKTIREKLRNQGGKLMLINAEGGIGKTTLAAKYWNESLHEYKHNAWLFCDGGIINALKELAPKLNLDLAGMDEQQQLNALRLALSEKQDGFLLVLDNANDEEDIKIFKQEFEGFHWHVLITSRCQGVLDKTQELPITHLQPPLAKELFERYYKEDTADFEHLLEQVLKSIQYHTLLTEVFAKNLAEAAEMGHLNLKTFLEKLENEGLHLGKNSFEIENNDWATKRKAATADDILDALYDFGQLSAEQELLMVNMALLPAEPYTLAFINSLLADDNDRTDRQIRDTLKTLLKKGWIGENEKKYRISPVIQRLVLEKNKKNLYQDSEILLTNLLKHLENDEYSFNKKLEDISPFIRINEHLNKYLNGVDLYLLNGINLDTGFYYQCAGPIEKAFLVFKKCLEDTIKFTQIETDPNFKNQLLASIYQKLEDVEKILGHSDSSKEHFQKGLSISEGLIESEPDNIDFIRKTLFYSRLGDFEIENDSKESLNNAYNYYIKENTLQKEIYHSPSEKLINKTGYPIAFSRLGNYYLRISDFENSEKCYTQYYELQTKNLELFPDNETINFGIATSLQKLGDVNYLDPSKSNEKAIYFYEESLKIFERLIIANPNNLKYLKSLSINYGMLSSLYFEKNQKRESLDLIRKSIGTFDIIISINPLDKTIKIEKAKSHYRLGEFLLKLEIPGANYEFQVCYSLLKESFPIKTLEIAVFFAKVVMNFIASSKLVFNPEIISEAYQALKKFQNTGAWNEYHYMLIEKLKTILESEY